MAQLYSPTYHVKYSEVRQNPNVESNISNIWLPSHRHDAHNLSSNFPTPHYFYYHGGKMQILDRIPASELGDWEFYSVYHYNRRLYLVDCDITKTTVNRPAVNDTSEHGSDQDDSGYRCWQEITFEHYEEHFTNVMFAGGKQLIQYHRSDQAWPNRLFPCSYHCSSPPTDPREPLGYIRGDLALILALIAMSVPATKVLETYTRHFDRGLWNIGAMEPTDWIQDGQQKRGVVVGVWSANSNNPGGSAQHASYTPVWR